MAFNLDVVFETFDCTGGDGEGCEIVRNMKVFSCSKHTMQVPD